MVKEIQKNVYFAYIRELEYIVAAGGLLAENLDGHLCRELYSEEFIDKMKHTYREVGEIMNSTKLGGFEMMEFLMSYRGEFSLDKFHQYILNLPLVDYVYQFFGYEVSKEEIAKALEDEEYLSKLYGEQRFHMKSYISLKQIIYNRKEFLKEYFDCIQAVRTTELENYLDQCQKQLEGLKEQVEKSLETMTPSQFGGEVLNSICCSSKEYEAYGFLPVFLLPRNIVTYYCEKSIFILYSSKRISEQQEALTILKAIGDDTRIRIIDLLSERKQENGKNLARHLMLTPSTVSHHMEQLIACGLVEEERCGNTKLYSIQQRKAQEFIEQLRGILLKNY